MPKNTKGGKGHKKGKNKTNVSQQDKKLVLKDTQDQNYGVVIKALGSMRFNLLCTNDKVVQALARGKFRKKIWINVGDLVIFSSRDTADDKVDIIHKYNENQAKEVKQKENLFFNIPEEGLPKNNLQSTGLKISFEANSDDSSDTSASSDTESHDVWDGNPNHKRTLNKVSNDEDDEREDRDEEEDRDDEEDRDEEDEEDRDEEEDRDDEEDEEDDDDRDDKIKQPVCQKINQSKQAVCQKKQSAAAFLRKDYKFDIDDL